MPTNIEFKAILTNRARAESVAARLSDASPETIHQEDFFFACGRGRLKLRVFAPDRGELIRYERANVAGARGSHYLIVRTPDPHVLLDILTATLGRTGIVKKTRVLYLIGQTRVHIDEVDGSENSSNSKSCSGRDKPRLKERAWQWHCCRSSESAKNS